MRMTWLLTWQFQLPTLKLTSIPSLVVLFWQWDWFWLLMCCKVYWTLQADWVWIGNCWGHIPSSPIFQGVQMVNCCSQNLLTVWTNGSKKNTIFFLLLLCCCDANDVSLTVCRKFWKDEVSSPRFDFYPYDNLHGREEWVQALICYCQAGDGQIIEG